jgi:perosamine synthetase
MIHVSQPSLGKAERDLVLQCLNNNRLTQGPMVEWFEKLLAGYLGSDNAVTTTSGTTALHLALSALGIGPGDEVLVPNVTFVATANAVALVGATPVLVDIDPLTWTMDVDDMCRKSSPRTKAVIPVHLYGMPCNMCDILLQAHTYGWKVIEDAAEGLGGSWKGKKLGTLGDVGCFSFYGNKIITTGEGGAAVTNDPELAKRMRFLRGQAMTAQRYFHSEVGFNYRMTDIQAAIGIGQIRRIESLLGKRRLVTKVYQELLEELVGEPALLPEGVEPAPWLYTALVPKRDWLMDQLAKRGVETRPTFVPLNRLPMFRSHESFPNSDLVGDHGISLPTHADMTPDDAAVVAATVLKVSRGGSSV